MDVSLDLAILVGIYTALAAVIDYREHRIPNYLTVPTALAGLAYHAVMPNGIGIPMALAGLAVGFSLLLLPWILGGGGMGDVKLLAALGAWMGPMMVLVAFAASIGMAAIMAIGILFVSTFTKGISKTRNKFMSSGSRPKRVLPFAIPVALSTWLILAWFVLKQSLVS